MLSAGPGAIARRIIGMAGLMGTVVCVPKPVGLAAVGVC